MKKKSKAAPLTSNLMARKGDQATARSGSAPGKLGVSELQDEIVARLADEVTRSAGLSFSPVQSASVQSASIRMEGMDLRDTPPPRPSLPSPEPASPQAALSPLPRQAPNARRLPVSRKAAALSDRSAFFNGGAADDDDSNETPRTKPSAILGSVFEVNFGRSDRQLTLDEAASEPDPLAALGPVAEPSEESPRLEAEVAEAVAPEFGASDIVVPPAQNEPAMAPHLLDVDVSRTGTLEDERTVPAMVAPRSSSFPFMLLFVLTVAISGAVGVWLTRGDEAPTQGVSAAPGADLTAPPPDLAATRPESAAPPQEAEPAPAPMAVPAAEPPTTVAKAEALPPKPVGKVETHPLPPAAAPAVVAKPAAPLVQPPEARTAAVAPLPAESAEAAPKLTGYSAQLMSAKRKAVAESEWTRLSQAYASLLGAQPHAVVSGEVPNKGTYYRLRVGQFDSIRDVQKFCAELDAMKLACMVVKN